MDSSSSHRGRSQVLISLIATLNGPRSDQKFRRQVGARNRCSASLERSGVWDDFCHPANAPFWQLSLGLCLFIKNLRFADLALPIWQIARPPVRRGRHNNRAKTIRYSVSQTWRGPCNSLLENAGFVKFFSETPLRQGCFMPRSFYSRISLALAFAIAAPALATAEGFPIAGLTPNQRPAGAPVITRFTPPSNWDERMFHGVSRPLPVNLEWTKDQGAWFTPFNRPGMRPPYDLRGWRNSEGTNW